MRQLLLFVKWMLMNVSIFVVVAAVAVVGSHVMVVVRERSKLRVIL
jgi:hypothetical protein